MNAERYINIGKKVFDVEITSLNTVRNALDETFATILAEMLQCEGKVIITGMGKSGHVGRKIAATMSSLGTSAFFLHPGECMHGDLGMIQKNDLLIAISYSGESEEIIKIIPGINKIGAKLIAITGSATSTLAKNTDIVQILPNFKEACLFGVAPTSSTTVAMVYGDALAVAASAKRNFGKEDFKNFHPAGALGKRLTLCVRDCMQYKREEALLDEESTIAEAIERFCETKWEILPVNDMDGAIIGTITMHSLQQELIKKPDIYNSKINELTNKDIFFTNIEELAIDALQLMTNIEKEALLVMNEEEIAGIVRMRDILNVGVTL